MSASPADITPGRTPGRTPNGGPAPFIRRPRNDDPLVRPKKRPTRPAPVNGQSQPPRNAGTKAATSKPLPQQRNDALPGSSRPLHQIAEPSNSASGFSSKPVGDVKDYPIILSKRELMDGLRFHVARFSTRRDKDSHPVDPRNTEEFVRPVRLHRRDPKMPMADAMGPTDTAMGGTDDLTEEQKRREELLKAEKEAAKEAEAALVAPAVNSQGQRRLAQNTKKTQQVYGNYQTEEQKARSKLRYEEALPWHLEDFDNKSIWVGSYEAALSDTYTMMVQQADGSFKMVPLEKWYKFTQKNQFKALTSEEAEARYNRKVKEPRWFMDSEETRKQRQGDQGGRKGGLFIGKWERGAAAGASSAPVTKNEAADVDDLDFTEDRFADDEENMVIEEDDDVKEAEERIKRDQLQANIFDLKEEKEYEKQELLERKEKDAEKKLGKHVKKALMKREKNYIYDSDSTDNPYSSESESESSEAERQKEAERLKSETKTTPEKAINPKVKPPGSGASSRGTNTPSGRPSKHPSPHPLPRNASSASLKRPGSPLASDASGNESTARKKKIKKHHGLTTSASQPNLQPPNRSISPSFPSSSAPQAQTSQPPKPTSKRPRGNAGSASDSEGAMGGAASGGEMSDGSRKRIKLKFTSKASPGVSPVGSRPHSPAAQPAPGATTGTASNGPSQPTTRPPSPPFPAASDIRRHIPAEGIQMGELLKHFTGQIVGKERKDRFMDLLKKNSRYIKETKTLVPVDVSK